MTTTLNLTELLKEKTKPLKVKARTIILNEGETCQKMYFINKGCVRVSVNNDGKDLTTQFFLEGDAVTILESFLYNTPSDFSIEAIEDCELGFITKKDFEVLLENHQEFKGWFYQTAIKKLVTLTQRLLTFIVSKPQERYAQLLNEQPEIIKRIPLRFIASYLGVTSVSLSRIRTRKSN